VDPPSPTMTRRRGRRPVVAGATTVRPRASRPAATHRTMTGTGLRHRAVPRGFIGSVLPSQPATPCARGAILVRTPHVFGRHLVGDARPAADRPTLGAHRRVAGGDAPLGGASAVAAPVRVVEVGGDAVRGELLLGEEDLSTELPVEHAGLLVLGLLLDPAL